MDFIWDGVKQAVDLLTSGDPDTYGIAWLTLKVAFWSTLFASILGLPVGLWLGLVRVPGRRVLLSGLNAGLGLPPVVVGLIVFLLVLRGGALDSFHLVYNVSGVIVAQTVLSFPIIAALTASAIQSLPRGLIDQARALSASRVQVAALALREAKVGVIAAVTAAVGSALSEVGAVVIVGGNIKDQTQTLASAILAKQSAGQYGESIALGMILLGMVLVLASALTIAQQREAAWTLRRPS